MKIDISNIQKSDKKDGTVYPKDMFIGIIILGESSGCLCRGVHWFQNLKMNENLVSELSLSKMIDIKVQREQID